MRYRKRPVVIEAVQFTPLTIAECEEFVGGDMGMTPDGPVIATLEGAMHVSIGDWIIRGVQGEFYPCKPDIFEQTYEPVDGTPHTHLPRDHPDVYDWRTHPCGCVTYFDIAQWRGVMVTRCAAHEAAAAAALAQDARSERRRASHGEAR